MKTNARFTPAMAPLIRDLLGKIGGDGHSVYKPAILDGFPDAIKARFTKVIKSDLNDPKQTITSPDGHILAQVQAVYGLDVLVAICDDLGLPFAPKMGRGFQAQACTQAIATWLDSLLQPKATEPSTPLEKAIKQED